MKAWQMNVRLIGLVALTCCLIGVGSSSAQAQTPFTYPPFPVSSATGLQTNGSAQVLPNGTTNFLRLTPSVGDLNGSAWYTNPAGIDENTAAPLALSGGFTTTFQIQFTNPGGLGHADGIVFVVQNGSINGTSGAGALGNGVGGQLGYTGLTNSVGVQFDTYCNAEYSDICNSKPGNTFSGADEISVQSCGPNANTSNHSATTVINSMTVTCTFGAIDLTTLATPIYLADGNPHSAMITYAAPPEPGSCTPGSTPNTGACGSLTIVLDTQTVLTVPFSLSYLGLDSNDDAFPGFTAATGGGYQDQDVSSWNFGTGTTVATTIAGTPLGTNQTETSDFSGKTTGSMDVFAITTPNIPTNSLGNAGATPFVTSVPTPQTTPPALWANSPLATAVCTPLISAGGLCAPKNEVCTTPTNLVPSGANCAYDTSGVQDVLLSDNYDPVTMIKSFNPGEDPGVVALNDNLTCGFAQQGSLPTPACPSNGSKSFTGPGELKTTHGTSNSYYYYVTGILPPHTTPSGFVAVSPNNNWVNGNTPVQMTLTATPPAGPGFNHWYPSPIDYVAYLNLPASATAPLATLPLPGGTVVYSSNNTKSSTPPLLSTVKVSQVAVGATAVYTYDGTSASGPPLQDGMSVTIIGFISGGNNVSAMITALGGSGASSTFTVPLTTQVNEIDPATATSTTTTTVVSTGQSTTPPSTCGSVIFPPPAAPGEILPADPAYSFPATANLGSLVEGPPYTLYYEAEDCTRTAERQYTYMLDPNLGINSWFTNYKSLTFSVDKTPPTIKVTIPGAGAIYPANASVTPAFTCTDGGSGISPYGSCKGSSSLLDTTPTGGILTSKTFTVTSTDNVGNMSSQPVNYSVSCLYATNTISPSSLVPGKLFIFKITPAVTNCTASSQALTINVVLSGPFGKNCALTPITLVKQLTVPIAAGKSYSQTFGPFILPTNACTNYPYVLTTTTSNNGVVVFTYSSTVTD